MKKDILLFGFCMFLLLVVNVSGTVLVAESTLGSNISHASYWGGFFTTSAIYNFTIVNVTKSSGDLSSVVVLFDNISQSIVASASYVGNTATFSPIFNPILNHSYLVLSNNSGVTRNVKYAGGLGDLPKAYTQLTYTLGTWGDGFSGTDNFVADSSKTQWNSIVSLGIENFSFTPTFNSSLYNITFPFENNGFSNNRNLTFGFTTTDVNYLNTKYTINTLINGGINVIDTCYQESANQSNQTGIDENCGLNYIGKYFFSNISAVGNPQRFYDGNFSTFANTGPLSSSLIYVNYSKPPNSTSVIWKIKYNAVNTNLLYRFLYCWNGTGFIDWAAISGSGITTENLVLPNICFNQNPIRLRFTIVADSFGSLSWFEESMNWSVNVILNSTNVTTIAKNYTFNLLDGKYYYGLTIFDIFGNNQFYDPNVTIDTINPIISFNANTTTNNSFNKNNIYISVIGNDTNINVTTINLYNNTGILVNSTFINISGVLSMNYSLLNGIYYYNASTTDLAGNINYTPTYFSTIINSFQNNSYNVTFPFANNGFSNNRNLTFGFTTTDSYYNYTNYEIISITGNNYSICYQGLPNGTVNCGALNIGIVYNNNDSTNGYIYFNYTRPITALNTSVWQIKYGYNGTGTSGISTPFNPYFYNVTIPNICWNNTLQLRLVSSTFNSIAYGQCYNSTGWQTITAISNGNSGGILFSQNNSLNLVIDGNYSTHAVYRNTFNPGWWTYNNNLFSDYYYAMIFEQGMFWNLSINNITTNDTSITRILSDGKYYYGLTIYDKADNNQFYDPNVTIDTVSPNVTFISPTPVNNQTIFIRFNVTNFTTFINVSDLNNITNLTVYLYNNSGVLQSNTWYNLTNSTQNYTFIVISPNIDTYYINATAYDFANNLGFTETRIIFSAIDSVFPVINFSAVGNSFNPNTNTSIISRDRYNLSYNVTYFDDDLFAAEVQVNCDISGQVYNWSFVGFNVSTTTYNKYDTFNISALPLQRCQFYTAASDSHTDEIIPRYDNAVLENGLSFLTENDNIVQIIADEEINNIQDISTQKLPDRQTFNFDFVDNKNSRTFRLLSNNKIYYIEKSQYPAHFVIWNPEEHKGNWVDFADKINNGDTYNVDKINDYEYDITITTPIATDKSEFNSIGGTLITNTTIDFYIGASIYTIGFTPYDNVTFGNYSYILTQLTGFPIFNHTGFLSTANGVIENLTNGTYIILFTHPQYLNSTYFINITNDSVYQNYTTYQSEANFRFVAFARNVFLNNVTYTLNDNIQNRTINGFTGNDSSVIFNLDASNYTLNFSIPGYNNGSINFTTTYQQNLTQDIDVSYSATFQLFDERTLGVFNISGATLVTFQLFCPGSTFYTVVNVTNFTVPINCDYTSFKFQLDYGTTGYYRSFILSPDETNNVPIYLIDATNTAFIYNSLVTDDLLKLYVNPRIFVYKNINNVTVQITANFVDITQKVGAFLIENNQYTVVIKSDNLPDFSIGLYAADTTGTVSIKLYEMSLYYQVEERSPTYFTGRIDNSTGDHLVLGHYLDTENKTESVTFNTYVGNTLLSTQSIPNTGEAVFTTNVSAYYINNTPTVSIYDEFIIVRNSTGISQQKSLLAEATGIDLGIWDYVSHDTVNWILIILLGVLAVIGTIQTANYVAIALIFIASLFVMFGWLGISASVLAIAGFVALVSLLKEGERNS